MLKARRRGANLGAVWDNEEEWRCRYSKGLLIFKRKGSRKPPRTLSLTEALHAANGQLALPI